MADRVTTVEPLLTPIRTRLEAASDGPWRWDENFGDVGDTGLALTNDARVEIVSAYNHHCCSFRDDPLVEDNDAVFIASAPTDIARLLAAVDVVLELADSYDEEAKRLSVEAERFIPGEVRSHYVGLSNDTRMKGHLIRAAVTAALEGSGE